MATCLNINDPEVKSIILLFNEVATSKILEVYNEKYTNRPLTPELATSIYNQIKLEKQSYIHPAIARNLDSLDRLKDELEKTDDFYSKLRGLIESTNWPAIIDLAKRAQIKNISLIGSSRILEDLASETDIKKIAEGILSYLYENSTYLKAMEEALSAHLADESIPEKERASTAYFATQLANQLKNSINDWKPYFKSMMDSTGTNFLKEVMASIESSAKAIKEKNEKFSIPRVAAELATVIHKQSQELLANNQKELEKLRAEKQRLERLQEQGPTKNRKQVVDTLKQAIAKLEKRAQQYATKENIQKALEEEGFENQDHVNWWSYWLESAQLSSNILTGSTGNFIWDMQTTADQNSQKFQNQMSKLVKKALDYYRSKGGNFLTSLDEDAFFDTYVREVDVVFVNQNGELETRQDLALQSEMDEIGYKNEKVRKEHAIAQKKLSGEDTFEDEENLARFVEANEDRGLTEEYYQVMSSLSLRAKRARKAIIDKMKLLESRDRGDILNDMVMEQIEDLRFQLERLESFVYLDGTPKVGEDLAIAEDIKKWKESTRAAQLFTYEPDEDKLNQWKAKLDEYTSAVTKAEKSYEEILDLYNKGEVTAASLSDAKRAIYVAKQNLDSWSKANVRRTIDPDWYKQRREILDAISEIQADYLEVFQEENVNIRTASEIWDEIFNLLKGYRDSNGIYVGTNIPLDISTRIKELQEELNSNMDEFKKAKLVSKEDKAILADLFAQLNDIQTRQSTDYYTAAYNNALSQTRAQVVVEFMQLNPDLALNYEKYLKEATLATQKKYPNLTALEIGEMAAREALNVLYEKESLLNTSAIDREVMIAFQKSPWFKANHIPVEKFDPMVRRKIKSFEPLYFWNEILPWDSINEVVDERYINRTTPSFRWNSYRVNDQVLNPQTGKPLFVNPDYKYIPGRVQLRPTSQYVNESYNNLDPTEREILAELTEMNQKSQQDLPASLRRGLVLPSVRKDKFTNFGLTLNPVEQLRLKYLDVRDNVLGVNEEDEDFLAGVKTSSRVHRKLYLKYSSNMDRGLKSRNVFASLSMFNHEAEKFKIALKNAPTLFGLEDILASKKIGKEEKGQYTVKMIENLYEKQLFGINTRDGKFGRLIGLLSDPLLSAGRKLSLNYNVPSAIKNFFSNLQNTLIQAGEFDLSPGDIFAGMGEGALHIKDLFLADRDTRVGRESDYVKMLDYFHVFPKEQNEKLRNIVNNPFREAKTYSPLSLLRFGRSFLEMETTIGIYEALLKKTFIKNTSGEQKTLKDAYEVVDGEIRIKPEFDEAEVKAQESYFMKKLHSITAVVNGAYAKMDQGEYKRFALGRLAGYMRSWLAYQAIRRFGGRRISYGGGYEYEGFYRAVVEQSYKFLKALTQGKEGIQAYMLTLDRTSRRALRGALYDTLAIVTLMGIAYVLSGLVRGDSGDDEDNWGTYFALYNLVYLIDEIETLHPIASPASIYYGRVTDKNTQVNIVQYYTSKNVLLPYQASYDLLREGYSFATQETYNLFDEYVQRDKDGYISNRKDVPINPALKGHSNIVALFLEQSKLAGSMNYFLNPEYRYRTFTHYNPKYYLQSTEEDLQETRKGMKQLKKAIKALSIEASQTDDVEYQTSLRRLIEQKQSELYWKSSEQRALLNEMEDNVIE